MDVSKLLEIHLRFFLRRRNENLKGGNEKAFHYSGSVRLLMCQNGAEYPLTSATII